MVVFAEAGNAKKMLKECKSERGARVCLPKIKNKKKKKKSKMSANCSRF